MFKETIKIHIKNEDALSIALGSLVEVCEEVELMSESASGRYILVMLDDAYIVFEKSREADVHDLPTCKYLALTFVDSEEKERIIDKILWRERGGVVALINRDKTGIRPSILVIFDEYAYEFSERRFRTKSDDPVFLMRKRYIRSFLGQTVEILINKPVGYIRKDDNNSLTYPVNYGCVYSDFSVKVPDVYLLGIDEPVSNCTAKIIGIVHRESDNDDVLIAAPEDMSFTKEEIEEQIAFQEKRYRHFIETEYSFFECSLKDSFMDRHLPDELEHRLLNKLLCPCDDNEFTFPSWKDYESLDEFKPYRDKEENGDMTIFRPEFVSCPRTLFTALWRKNRKITDKTKLNLRFYFNDDKLMMTVESEAE